MTLVLGLITPHPPVLIETIGKESRAQLQKTMEGYAKAQELVLLSHPDTVIVLSSHRREVSDSLYINLANTYRANYAEFGDYSDIPFQYKTDVELIHEIHSCLSKNFSITLSTEDEIDYGVSIPLQFLLQKQGIFPKIVPLNDSSRDKDWHYAVGRELKNVILNSNKNILLVASADLSHRLAQNAPGGFSPQGAVFDHKIVEIIEKQKFSEILKLNPELAKEAGTCGMNIFSMFFGVLETMKLTSTVISYEYPFGIGYLIASFQ